MTNLHREQLPIIWFDMPYASAADYNHGEFGYKDTANASENVHSIRHEYHCVSCVRPLERL